MTNEENKELSDCCKAQIRIVGDIEGTHYFACNKCNKPCDLYIEREIEKLSDGKLLDSFLRNGYYRDEEKQELLKRLEDGWKYRDLNK